jgi:predicted flap endonuclease-1-like 5' DNA nuclease
VIDHDRTSIIATLERVSAQLEAFMDSMGDRHANEIAGSAVRKSWKLVGEAIDHLRSIRGDSESIADRAEADALDKPDDLTSIRGISTAFAGHLASLGVTRYAGIAAWRADDVRRISQALELPREISRQNWIEQAALLERRKKWREGETMELPQSVAALSAGEAAPTQKTDGLAAPDVANQIDLPEILEAIRSDEPENEKPLPPLRAKSAPQDPSRPAEADVAPLAVVIGERVAPSTSPTAVVSRLQQTDVAPAESVGARLARPNSQGPRVPTVTVSSHASTDATERVRRLEEEKQRLTRNLGRVGELPAEPEEAAVSFVIREEAQSQPSAAASSTLSRRSTFLGRTRDRETGAETYIANGGSTEEAEVVVVKPQVQNRYGPVGRPEGGTVRRFLKALKGG